MNALPKGPLAPFGALPSVADPPWVLSHDSSGRANFWEGPAAHDGAVSERLLPPGLKVQNVSNPLDAQQIEKVACW